jgi:two-component system sensor histidine kinase YesM
LINICIDETLFNYKIPNLTLQPILENSISYALEVAITDCRIDITAEKVNDEIILTVKDNGPGVDLNKLEKLQNMEIEPSTSGIGLKNIDERIKIIFGNQYGLRINSEKGKWFKVEISIPAMKEEENNV